MLHVTPDEIFIFMETNLIKNEVSNLQLLHGHIFFENITSSRITRYIIPQIRVYAIYVLIWYLCTIKCPYYFALA